MSGEAFHKASGPDEAEPIAYAPSATVVSVRGFRLLVFLTLVNTVLLAGFVLGPQFFAFGSGQWAAYQQRKAERERHVKTIARREAAMAAEAKAMAYAAAPGTLVYDDDPARRAPSASAGTPVAPWPAVIPRPSEADALPAEFVGTTTLLFMHERRASASSPARLVLVRLGSPGAFRVAPEAHVFDATTIQPTSTDSDPTQVWTDRILFHPPKDLPLRLFAGEPDENDASRFVIPYEFAGERGLLHGQLQGDNSIRLIPDGPLLDRWPKQ